jgi:hypothetical protein
MRSRDHEISPPFVGFLGFRVYVTGMGCWPMGLPMFRLGISILGFLHGKQKIQHHKVPNAKISKGTR